MFIVEDKRLNGAESKVKHAFFGSQGGVSQGIYESLNCGVGSDDAPEAVQKNREIVAQHFGVGVEQLVGVWQVHSPDCVIIKAPFAKEAARPKADAMVTDKAGIVLGVLTADCGPILLAGEKADGTLVIGAAHAGWGGALNGVLESTVMRMQELGAELPTIRAAIGPCIGPKSYEVTIGYEKPFLERNPDDEHFFREAQKEGHLMFDLPGYIASRLAEAGLRQVTITGHDTFAEADKFFSNRRRNHRGQPDYGRQISAIMIQTIV